MRSENATPPRPLHCRGEARWRPLASQNISYRLKPYIRSVNGSGKVDSHQDSDQHENVITSRG